MKKELILKSNNCEQNNKDKLLKILTEIKSPQNKLQNIIHITGTNGKGSTAKTIQSILIESGYSANLYTSPHLININERYNLNGKNVKDADLLKIHEKIKKLNTKDLGFFCKSVLCAILLFEQNIAEFNIFEVGIGGMLDATNVFNSKILSVITSISLDHTEKLGNTIDKISYDKAHIISQNSIAISDCQEKTAILQISQRASKVNSQLFYCNKDWVISQHRNKYNIFDYSFPLQNLEIKNIKLGLLGIHQSHNASLAITGCWLIRNMNSKYRNINIKNIRKGISNTRWRCRLEEITLEQSPNITFLLDGAHNKNGIETLSKFIKPTNNQFNYNIGLFAHLQKKKFEELSDMIENLFDQLFITTIKRKTEPVFATTQEIRERLKNTKLQIEELEEFNINKIIERFKNKKRVRIIVFGSLHFVGYVRDKLCPQQKD